MNVSSVLNGLDMQIAATQQIRQSLEALSRRCTTEQTQLEAMTQMLLAASDRFTQTDQKLGRQAKGLNNLADDMQSAVSGMAATAVGLKGIDQNLKVSELNQAFGISQNNTTQDGVTLAKKEKSGKNVFEYSIPNDGKNGTEVDIKALGYEAGDGEYEAYLAKITGKDAFMIGGAVAVGTVAGVTIGSAHAGAGFSADLFESSKKASAKEGMKTGASLSSGDTFYEEMDGSVTGDDKFDLFNVGVKAEAGATVARFDYNTTIGTEKYNGYVDANVKLLDANAGAAFGAKYGSDGLSVLGKAEVGASLAEVEGTVGGTGSVPRLTEGASSLAVSYTGKDGLLDTRASVNLDKIRKVCAVISGNGSAKSALAVSAGSGAIGFPPNVKASKSLFNGTVELDVSALSGNHFVGFKVEGDFTVEAVWLSY